jgi:hypothetical protein
VLVGVVAAVGLVAGVVLAVAGAPAASAAGSCQGTLAGGEIRVVVVVDPGPTGPSGPSSACLVVRAGTSGAQVLAQRASQLGLASPRYAGSGLLCALDGFPAAGCPTNDGGAYDYWAYFNARGGSWAYGTDNPFVRRLVDGEIMGWRYSVGLPDGAAPAPRLAPSASLFPPLTPATTAPPAPAPPAPGAPGAATPPAAGAATPGGGPAPGDGTVADPSAATVAPDPAAGDAGTSDTTAPADATGATDGSVAAADTEELAAAPASSNDAAPGRWIGVVVAVAVVGALAVGGVSRSRRRAGR